MNNTYKPEPASPTVIDLNNKRRLERIKFLKRRVDQCTKYSLNARLKTAKRELARLEGVS